MAEAYFLQLNPIAAIHPMAAGSLVSIGESTPFVVDEQSERILVACQHPIPESELVDALKDAMGLSATAALSAIDDLVFASALLRQTKPDERT